MFNNRTLLPIIAFCAVIINGVTANADNPVESLCKTYQDKCEKANSNMDKCNVWQDKKFQDELGNFQDKGLDWKTKEQHAFFTKVINCNESNSCNEIGELCLKFAKTYVEP